MDKTYSPSHIEKRWYEHWEQSGYFKPDTTAEEAYAIVIPPPNVTGRLHMGHGFQNALMDTLIRYQRMQGKNTLWQVGTDHAGIATQMIVERQLQQDGVSRHDLGRDTFVKKVWEWKEQSGGFITQQMRRLGNSTDWSRERFTMDEGFSKAVQTVFISLYKQDLIYRGKRLVNWDPVLQTAISDLEVVQKEVEGTLTYIRYPLAEDDGHLTIATTRPETLFGDVAVAIHPEDPRYQSLIGKTLSLPLTHRTIPILADPMVDPEFGTGCVKITPAHDFNDAEMGKRHGLSALNILTPEALLNDAVPEAFQGMTTQDARTAVIEALSAQGLIEKQDPHTHKVPHGDRSGSVIEPYLTNQWFVRAKPLAKKAIEVVEQGKIQFVPEQWTHTYYQWMHNIEDWCISRQLWWGHRVPAWHDESGTIYVGENEAAVRAENQLDDNITLTQDNDVLDTWFSSALWPFGTLGWPHDSKELKTYYPTAVLVTGFDIIFFWVARMIMMGLQFTDEIPFHTVYVTGLIRDSYGQKMSKSKGNVLDPIDLIDGVDLDTLLQKRTQGLMQPQLKKEIETNTRKEFPEGIEAHGTDALRLTFCALASPSRDLRFDKQKLHTYRNFCNKLWNAARYVLMQTETSEKLTEAADSTLLVDRWIQSRLQSTIASVHQHFEQYRFDLVVHTLHHFIWHDFCDWYLELSKPVLFSDDTSVEQKRSTQKTLVTTLEALLRLMHPIAPFVTEEIWQKLITPLALQTSSIMQAPFPPFEENKQDTSIEKNMQWLQRVIGAVRQIRGEMNIPHNVSVTMHYKNAKKVHEKRFQDLAPLLKSLAKIEHIAPYEETDAACATAWVDSLELIIPLAGLIDIEAECARLEKQIQKNQKTLDGLEKRLQNERFLENAPEAVVAKEREQAKALTQLIENMREQAASLRKA